jgi:hypothetical protein
MTGVEDDIEESGHDHHHESFCRNPGDGCRIGAVVFVAGVAPPTRGGARAKEPRL